MASIFTSFFCCSSLLLLGIQITSFTQADLTSRNIQYIHSSESEKHSDAFSFTLSDGVNEVSEKLHSLLEKVTHRAVCRATGLSYQSFISPCSQPRTEAASDSPWGSCPRELTFEFLVSPTCQEWCEKESRGPLPSTWVGLGTRVPPACTFVPF